MTQKEQDILDRIEHEIGRHTWFDRDEKYVVNILWIAGTYFPGYSDIRVFDNFPMLAFMSPEPDSGKSRALKVTKLLSCNSIDVGQYTPAALLHTIDQSEKMITICLDEIDTVFAHVKIMRT